MVCNCCSVRAGLIVLSVPSDQEDASIAARRLNVPKYVVKIADSAVRRIKDRPRWIEHREDGTTRTSDTIVRKHAAAEIHVRICRENISRLADHRPQYLVEVDTETATNDGVRRRGIGESEPRRKVVVVALVYARSSVDESA
jgi:hypothetical protein